MDLGTPLGEMASCQHQLLACPNFESWIYTELCQWAEFTSTVLAQSWMKWECREVSFPPKQCTCKISQSLLFTKAVETTQWNDFMSNTSFWYQEVLNYYVRKGISWEKHCSHLHSICAFKAVWSHCFLHDFLDSCLSDMLCVSCLPEESVSVLAMQWLHSSFWVFANGYTYIGLNEYEITQWDDLWVISNKRVPNLLSWNGIHTRLLSPESRFQLEWMSYLSTTGY